LFLSNELGGMVINGICCFCSNLGSLLHRAIYIVLVVEQNFLQG